MVSFGLFSLSQTNLTDAASSNLNESGCCNKTAPSSYCGCTYNVDSDRAEYKLDEVCINEMFNASEFKGSPNSFFCTSKDDRFINIDDLYYYKFGNRGCYANLANTQPPTEGWSWTWKDACSPLCNAKTYSGADGCNHFDVNGDETDRPECEKYGCNWCGCFSPAGGSHGAACFNYNKSSCLSPNWWKGCEGTPTLQPKDSDRIYKWSSDDISNKTLVDNDNALTGSSQPVKQDGSLYFYNVLWDDGKKQYEIDFPRIVSQDKKEFADSTEFYDFLKYFFVDQNSNIDYGLYHARSTIGGIWWPELRTNYDGVITLNENTTVTKLRLALEQRTSNSIEVVSCSNTGECLDYTVPLQIFEEVLLRKRISLTQGEERLDGITPYQSSLYLRVYNSKEEKLPAGKYRLIIRDWYSNLWQESTPLESCGGTFTGRTQPWCIDYSKKIGYKIWCNVGSCPAGSYFPNCVGQYGSQICNRYLNIRYIDKSIILIKLPECKDSDSTSQYPDGKNYFMPGTATLDGQAETDECEDLSHLWEKYCGKDNQEMDIIKNIRTNCNWQPGGPYMCLNGACAG